ncbi:MAG TPA: PadR family transcriptional regulator [Micromonosporaceae bacterium]|jgi:DNA-binding PadR family transcriptional regulator|nr:PadR family transcriptional regulator [Micromonosporaceae bacterium]
MTAVFSHGRLRLYLLKLLAEGPKHGYELIRLLENRFLGLYAPSAGTIYPRLARLENEGLVNHSAAGGRKTYHITDAGRAELATRAGELAELEAEIHASVADLTTLASDIERQVSGSVADIKRELREASRHARPPREPWADGQRGWDWDWSAWRRQAWRERSSAERDRPAAERERRSTGDDGASRSRAEAKGASTAHADSAEASDADLGDLASALTELAAEVRRAARQAGARESDIRSATAVVVSALHELRRLLRR